MGNHSGKDVSNCPPPDPHQGKLEQLYEKLLDDDVVSAAIFEDYFNGPDVGVTKRLYEQFIDLVKASDETRSLFVNRCHHILHLNGVSLISFCFDLVAGTSPELCCDELKKIISTFCMFGIYQDTMEEDDLPQTCFNFDANDIIICSVAKTILNRKEQVTREDAVSWMAENCSKMVCGLHTWLEYKLIGTVNKSKFTMLPQPSECSSMNLLLSPPCLWYVCCILPSCYTYMENKFKSDEENQPDNQDTKYTWNLLYNSNQHGLSLNRFKHKVMEYKSPTVLLFEFSSGSVLMLALDEKWKDSPEKYGGHYCQLVELSPTLSVIEASAKMCYLKERGNTLPTGLLIGCDTKPKVKISTDLNSAELYYKNQLDEQVERMEVWGCGGVEALKTQEDIKKWEKRETEKRKKVKLPGQWEADKSILEMGGVRVNHSERGEQR